MSVRLRALTGVLLAALQPLASPVDAQVVVDLRAQNPQRRVPTPGNCVLVGPPLRSLPLGFHQINSAVPGTGGSVLVLNTGTNHLSRVNARGSESFLMAPGDGRGSLSRQPGDARRMRVELYRGDSVVVYDAMRRTVTILAPDGSVGREMVTDVDVDREATPRMFMVGASLTDGDLVFTRSTLATPPRLGPDGGMYTDTTNIVRLSADGRSVWVSGPIEALTREILGSLRGGRIPPEANIFRRGYNRSRSTVVVGALVFHYNEGKHELIGHERNGTVVTRILLPTMADPASMPGAPQRQGLTMLSDDAQRIWFEVPRTKQDQKRQWWVISATGSEFASAETPIRDEVLFIGARGMITKHVAADITQSISMCEGRS